MEVESTAVTLVTDESSSATRVSSKGCRCLGTAPLGALPSPPTHRHLTYRCLWAPARFRRVPW